MSGSIYTLTISLYRPAVYWLFARFFKFLAYSTRRWFVSAFHPVALPSQWGGADQSGYSVAISVASDEVWV
jgi:hypothetical protein